MIRSTSMSRLQKYEACPYRSKLKLVDKIPEPERPLPPGKTEHANDRGTRIHTGCEEFINGKSTTFPIEARKFKEELHSLKSFFKKGLVSMEGEWGFSKEWQPVDWRLAWLRVKLDVLVFLKPTNAVIVDWKTGSSFGNQIKHGEQTQLYTATTCIRYPAVQHVTTELWYLDQDELVQNSFSREQALRFVKPFDRRFKAMTEATEFKPRPNPISCKYCPYHPVRGTGDCKFGV